jgi:hypothetical protein
MPYPPPNKARNGFPLLEKEAMDFYCQLPCDNPISVSERYTFWPADVRVMLRKVNRALELIPEATRQVGMIKQRKEVIYALDHGGNIVGFTTWNRDPNQRIVSLFKLFDAERVTELVLLARLRGCRRSKSGKNILPMHALHGAIIIGPTDGFSSLVEYTLRP